MLVSSYRVFLLLILFTSACSFTLLRAQQPLEMGLDGHSTRITVGAATL